MREPSGTENWCITSSSYHYRWLAFMTILYTGFLPLLSHMDQALTGWALSCHWCPERKEGVSVMKCREAVHSCAGQWLLEASLHRNGSQPSL